MAPNTPKIIVDTISGSISYKKSFMEVTIRKAGKERMARAVRDLAIETQKQHETRLREKLNAIKTEIEEDLNRLRQQTLRDEKELQKMISGEEDVVSKDGDLAAALLHSGERVLTEYLEQVDPQPRPNYSSGFKSSRDREVPADTEGANPPTKEGSTQNPDVSSPRQSGPSSHRMIMALTPQKPARRGIKRKLICDDDDDDDDDDLPLWRNTRDTANTASTGDINDEIPSQLPRWPGATPADRSQGSNSSSSSNNNNNNSTLESPTVPTPPTTNSIASGTASRDPFTSTRIPSPSPRDNKGRTLFFQDDDDANAPTRSQRPQRAAKCTAKRTPLYNARRYFQARGIP
ncbi:hypothetical protein F4779DRAFT_369980 [Xylariaceae sp. FL0662B]|nr:hypothetical protein F4779DRAFT_369980 [Xylariaceae sp. FL0662B]